VSRKQHNEQKSWKMSSSPELLIKPRCGWQPVDLRELWLYRELLVYLAWRDIKVRYKQTILGGLWAVLQPLIGTVIFAVLFTRVVSIKSNDCPYPLFAYSGLVCWTFFSNALQLSSNSLVGSANLISKTYFPRILIPLGTILALMLDMLIGFAVMVILVICYRWHVTFALLWLPIFIIGSFLAASGMGLLLSAWIVKYRDLRYVVPFFIQITFFVTPVVYPVNYVPSGWLRMLLGLNPMAGMVEGTRHAVLSTPLSWALVCSSTIVSGLLFVAGLYVFRRMERIFADVI
jgi:lipopolysaccharide transport system permease protein